MINTLRYFISHGLAQAGYDSTVVAPVLNIFTLLESELSMSGFQFSAELTSEFDKLDQAMMMLNSDEGLEDLDDLDDIDEDDEDEDDWEDDDWNEDEDDDEDEE